MSETLRCLKKLLGDFSHHAIDMSCHLVECCGRFLFLHRKLTIFLLPAQRFFNLFNTIHLKKNLFSAKPYPRYIFRRYIIVL